MPKTEMCTILIRVASFASWYIGTFALPKHAESTLAFRIVGAGITGLQFANTVVFKRRENAILAANLHASTELDATPTPAFSAVLTRCSESIELPPAKAKITKLADTLKIEQTWLCIG